MKTIRYAVGGLAGLVAAGYPFLALTYSTGAPSGFSGPEQNCSACHNDFPVNSGAGSVTITAPDEFVPGVPVNLTVTVLNATPPEPVNLQGFEVSVRDAANTSTRLQGFVVDGVTVQNAQGSPEFVTHTQGSNTGNTWNFQWVPPLVGSPEAVTIFAAGNAANGNGDNLGDYIYTTSVNVDRTTVAEEEGPAVAALRLGAVTPNPVRGSAVVTLTLEHTSHVVARLLDASGREVMSVVDAELGRGETTLRVETAGLTTGTYLLQVEAAGMRASRRLTVAR
jgi:hypothetical protein